MKNYLNNLGKYIDVIYIGPELCGHGPPLISRDTYRKMIRRYYKAYFDIIEQNTQAKLRMHSCGTLRYVSHDVIELGVDIINPVKASARNIDPQILKEQSANRVTFSGAIDTQNLPPQGTPDGEHQMTSGKGYAK